MNGLTTTVHRRHLVPHRAQAPRGRNRGRYVEVVARQQAVRRLQREAAQTRPDLSEQLADLVHLLPALDALVQLEPAQGLPVRHASGADELADQGGRHAREGELCDLQGLGRVAFVGAEVLVRKEVPVRVLLHAQGAYDGEEAEEAEEIVEVVLRDVR